MIFENIVLFLYGISSVVSSNELKYVDFANALVARRLIDDYIGLNVVQLIQKFGYPVTRYSDVKTEDGYLLDIHRIPNGRNKSDVRKPPVLLMHGLFSSAADWITAGPEKSLAFLLADLGHDVWIGNARGTTHSRKHATLDPKKDKAEFWDFSWHEIGYYDLPAIIDFIIKKTGEEKIFYVGHSQGTTAFYVMASEKPEYNQKIRLMISLAPVAYSSKMGNPIFQMTSRHFTLIEVIIKISVQDENETSLSQIFFRALGIYELMPHNELITLAGKVFCNDDSPLQNFCAIVFFLFGGFNPGQFNKTLIPIISSNAPAGASLKQWCHFGQIMKSGFFRKYDYGILNFIVYKNATPPDYNVNQITAPTAIFYSENDWLSAVEDVQQLLEKLKNVVYTHLNENILFTHLDYLWAIDVVPLLYKYLIDLLQRY